MPTDPKFRTIARASGQPLATVIAMFVLMMTDASANAVERGRTQISDEDIASALDIDDGAVSTIRAAMQGRVLDGDMLSGWEARQPKREDNSAERARAWRENKKAENSTERNRTQSNAQERPDTDTDTDTDISSLTSFENRAHKPERIRTDDEKPKPKRSKAVPAPENWTPPEKLVGEILTEHGITRQQFDAELKCYVDWSRSSPNGAKVDHCAALRNWFRRDVGKFAQSRSPPIPTPRYDESKSVSAAAKRLRENGFQFGPRPQSAAEQLGFIPRRDDGRLLPARGCDEPGNVLCGDSSGTVGLSGGSDRKSNGP